MRYQQTEDIAGRLHRK